MRAGTRRPVIRACSMMYAVLRVKGARDPRVDPQPGDTLLPVNGDSRSVVARNGDRVEIHMGMMEYVGGQDLRGPMDFEDALPIIQQLIDGIEAAHEKNVVHRDLKPANIKSD